MSEFTPQIIQEDEHSAQISLRVRVRKCPICNKLMFPDKEGHNNRAWNELLWYSADKHQQMKSLRMVSTGEYVPMLEEYICEECTQAGRATFICKLCNHERAINLVQHSWIGDALCTVCYESMSAKIWNEKYQELESAHRWDYA